jgi:hypothetical protein
MHVLTELKFGILSKLQLFPFCYLNLTFLLFSEEDRLGARLYPTYRDAVCLFCAGLETNTAYLTALRLVVREL